MILYSGGIIQEKSDKAQFFGLAITKKKKEDKLQEKSINQNIPLKLQCNLKNIQTCQNRKRKPKVGGYAVRRTDLFFLVRRRNQVG